MGSVQRGRSFAHFFNTEGASVITRMRKRRWAVPQVGVVDIHFCEDQGAEGKKLQDLHF